MGKQSAYDTWGGSDVTRILVAEDDDALRGLVVLILRRDGHDVSEVGDGALALAAVLARRPDVVVLDGQMPNLTGQQVCERVRAESAVADVPILMLSGAMVPSDLAGGDLACPDAYLQKPFTTDQLVQSVRALVAHGGRGPLQSAIS
jgi:DNA-binding response OmpR family regulator